MTVRAPREFEATTRLDVFRFTGFNYETPVKSPH